MGAPTTAARGQSRRGPLASVLITALVMVGSLLAAVAAIMLVLIIVTSNPTSDQWDDLGSVIVAIILCALLLPVFATIVLHLLKVPRSVLIMIASAITIGFDSGVTRLVFNDADQRWALASLVLIPAFWALVLHPRVLRIGSG